MMAAVAVIASPGQHLRQFTIQREEGSRMSTVSSKVLDTKRAATYVGLSASTLNKLRVNGDGPAYVKLGRAVVYRIKDLDDWLLEHRRTRTA